jgi:hypothetical protein
VYLTSLSKPNTNANMDQEVDLAPQELFLTPWQLKELNTYLNRETERLQREQKYRQHRIQSWLTCIDTEPTTLSSLDSQESDLPEPDSQEPEPPVLQGQYSQSPSKRARHTSDSTDNDIFTNPYNVAMSLPLTGTDGARKRSNEEVYFDAGNVTPQVFWSALQVHGQRPRLHPRPRVSIPQTLDDLELLETPIFFLAMPISQENAAEMLPPDIQALYGHLLDASNRKEIIPHEVRDDVETFGVNPLPSLFREPESTGNGDTKARVTLERLCEIVQESWDSVHTKRHECGWNHIHGSLLRLVYPFTILALHDVFHRKITKPEVGVRCEPVMSATIAGNCIPMIRSPGDGQPKLTCPIEVDSDVMQSPASQRTTALSTANISTGISMSNGHSSASNRKVDYSLVLDLQRDAVLSRTISDILLNIDSSRLGKLHFNHTAYEPLRRSLIAVSIETKTDTPSTEAVIQLSIWFAAWYKRMHSLRTQWGFERMRRGLATNNVHCLVTIPLIKVVGQEWNLYLACDRKDQIHVYGPFTIGSTCSLASAYVLLASLKAIRDWVKGSFYDAMKEWFMCDAEMEGQMTD